MIPATVKGSNLGIAGEAIAALAIVLALFPGVFGARTWVAAAALLVAVGAIAVVARPGIPAAAVPLLAYVALFAAAAVQGRNFSGSSGARYLLRPLLAVAIATVPVGAAGRARLLRVIVAAAAFEGLVAIVQCIALVVRYGGGATSRADNVTGTLGTGQAAVLAFLCLLGAAIALGPWLIGAAPSAFAATAAAVVLAAGIATSTRAVPLVVPFVGIAAAIFLFVLARRAADMRRLALVAVIAAVYAPVSYGAIKAVYPGAFTGVVSSQNALVLGPRQPTHPVVRKRRHATRTKPKPAQPAAPVNVGVQLLPGRFGQLRTALRISHESGLGVLLLGRGYDSTDLDPAIQDPDAVPLPERTGPTWIGRVLTECGWRGLIAFVALLLWLAARGVTLARARERIGPALPFLAALTAAGAVETTILDVRAYSIPFWIVVGLAAGAPPSGYFGNLLIRSGRRRRVIADSN